MDAMAADRKLVLTILGDASQALKALDKTQGQLGQLGTAASTAAKLVAGVGIAGAAAVAGGIAMSIKAYADAGDALNDLHLKTGLSVEELSRLKYAAELSGTSIEGIEKASKKMASTIEDAKDGLGTTTKAFDKLGVSVDSLAGLTPDQQFNKLAMAIADVDDPLQRAALAQDIFGKSGIDLLPMLADGAAGLQAMKDEADKLGIVLSGEDAKAADEFNDKMSSIMARVDAAKFSIASNLIPVLIDLMDWLGPKLTAASALAQQALDRVQQWIVDHEAEIRAFFENAKKVAEALWGSFVSGVEVVLPLLIKLGTWIVSNKPILIAAIAAIGIAIVTALGPGTLAILAIAGVITAIGALRDNWQAISDKIKELLGGLKQWIVDHLDLIALALGGPVLLAVVHFRDEITGAFNAVWDVVEKVAGWIIGKIDAVKSALSSMPSPSDIPGASLIGDAISGITSANPFKANGGPVQAGVAYRVGERGPETFIPGVSGRIVPNGGGAALHFHYHGSVLGTPVEVEDAVLRAIKQARKRGEPI